MKNDFIKVGEVCLYDGKPVYIIERGEASVRYQPIKLDGTLGRRAFGYFFKFTKYVGKVKIHFTLT
jgi:hypothetical protein